MKNNFCKSIFFKIIFKLIPKGGIEPRSVIKLKRILVLASLFLIIINNSNAQINTNDLLIEKSDVKKCMIGRTYKTIVTKELGIDYNLDFELISFKNENDSIIISFILWYCPYYNQNDLSQHDKKDCQCNDEYFACKLVKVKQELEFEIGKKYKQGIYRVQRTLKNQLCINEEHKIKLKIGDEYNLIFKLDKKNLLYVRLI